MFESSNGAKASAILYSLIETAKANMINTFEYFNPLLTNIPQHIDDKPSILSLVTKKNAPPIQKALIFSMCISIL